MVNALSAPNERRAHAMRLLAEGVSTAEVARRIGVARQTVSSWARAHAPEGAVPTRKRGRPAALGAEQKRRLQALLSTGASLAGFPSDDWTLQRVQIVVAREFAIQYSLSNVSSLLKSLGLSTERSADDRAVLRLEVSERPLRKDEAGVPVQPIYQLADHLPDALMRYDLLLRRTYVNPGWEAITGMSAGMVLGKTLDEAPCPLECDRGASQRVLHQVVRRVALSHQAEYVDLRTTLHSGRVVDLHMRVLPEFDASGQCVAVLAIVRNESTPAELRRRLEWAERWLTELQRDGQMGYLSFEEHGALESISPCACALLGHAPTWRPSLEAWVVSFFADDRAAVADAVAQLTSRRKNKISVDVGGTHVQPRQRMRIAMRVESRGRGLPRRISATVRVLAEDATASC